MNLSRTALALAMLLGAATPALAQWSLNPNAPVSVRSDEEGSFNLNTCRGVLKGSVEVTQDRIRLRARNMVTQSARRGGNCEAITRVEADNDVYYVTPNEAVRADHAVYDLASDTVTFRGGVIVQRGQNVATADRMVINLRTNETTLTGGVRSVFYPNRSGG